MSKERNEYARQFIRRHLRQAGSRYVEACSVHGEDEVDPACNECTIGLRRAKYSLEYEEALMRGDFDGVSSALRLIYESGDAEFDRGDHTRGIEATFEGSSSGYILPDSMNPQQFETPEPIRALLRRMRVESRPADPAPPASEMRNVSTRIEASDGTTIETFEVRREVRPDEIVPSGALEEHEQLVCKICGAQISSCELCAECARTNDPFGADPDSHEHRPRTEV